MPPNSLFFLTVAMSLMFIASLSFASEVARSYQKKSHKLHQLKEQIKDLSSDIENRKSAFDKLTQRLRQSEITIGKTAHTLTKIKLHITKTTQQLDRLTRANQQQKLTLSQQKNILSQQLNAWFIMDNKTPLKMLFNQEDPAHSGRISQYYTLFNQAILKTITQLDIAQKKHNKQRHLIQEKTQTLETLLAETLLQQKQLSRQQTIQQQARQKLKSTVKKKTQRLDILKKDVANLENLLSTLPPQKPITSKKPFSSLKGKLKWPINGTVQPLKKRHRLHKNGLFITANPGTKVFSTASGSVVFADWLRGYGLLIIIDHGQGFMSLYGHNKTLLKNTGNAVNSNTAIALSGKTGGHSQAGLYFEIRQQAKPLKPQKWLTEKGH